jgi:AraC family transcriptional regulator, transcriptional activator of pobA
MIYTDKSAKEIGYELGFEAMAHFSRFFKNLFGVPNLILRHNKLRI